MHDLKTRRVGVVSGGFDPFHAGHLNLMLAAKQKSDQLVVIVESDEYVASKHQVLMPQADRALIIGELECVDLVLLNDAADGDSSRLLSMLRPDTFYVGPDYVKVERLQEFKTCEAYGINIVCIGAFGLSKTRSSSAIVKRVFEHV